MIRRLSSLLLAATLLVAGLGSADEPAPLAKEPPVRLKKKNKADAPEAPKTPPAEEKKPQSPPKEGDPKPEPEAQPEMPPIGEDEKEVLARIARNMQASEDRLGKPDLSDGTRQVQQDILKDLDALIQLSQQQQQQQQQQESDPSSSPPGAQQQQQQQQRNQQSRGNRRQSRNQQMARNRQQGKGQPQDKQNQTTEDQAKNGDRPGGGGGKEEKGANKIADIYKDVWGHLPESLRGEMNAYSREQFMAKYKDLIEQYYATVSEKGRKKGD